jgi:hypothetical protein
MSTSYRFRTVDYDTAQPIFVIRGTDIKVIVEPSKPVSISVTVANIGTDYGECEVRILDESGTVVAKSEILRLKDNMSTTATITFRAPVHTGTYHWKILAYNLTMSRYDGKLSMTIFVQPLTEPWPPPAEEPRQPPPRELPDLLSAPRQTDEQSASDIEQRISDSTHTVVVMPAPSSEQIDGFSSGVGVTTAESPAGTVAVEIRVASGAGTVYPSPGIHYYSRNDQIIIKATPDPGYSFDYYLVDNKEPVFKSVMKLTVGDNHVIEVYFSPGIRKSRLILPKILYFIRRVVR